MKRKLYYEVLSREELVALFNDYKSGDHHVEKKKALSENLIHASTYTKGVLHNLKKRMILDGMSTTVSGRKYVWA